MRIPSTSYRQNNGISGFDHVPLTSGLIGFRSNQVDELANAHWNAIGGCVPFGPATGSGGGPAGNWGGFSGGGGGGSGGVSQNSGVSQEGGNTGLGSLGGGATAPHANQNNKPAVIQFVFPYIILLWGMGGARVADLVEGDSVCCIPGTSGMGHGVPPQNGMTCCDLSANLPCCSLGVFMLGKPCIPCLIGNVLKGAFGK